MKVKNDFVTNSSSTCFYFCAKEALTIEVFEKLLKKYSKIFTLSYRYGEYSASEGEIWSCNPDDIMSALKATMELRKNDKWWTDPFNTKMIDLNIFKGDKIASMSESITNDLYHHWNSQWEIDDLTNHHIESFEQVLQLMDIQDKGFTHVVSISFGDNDGYISGGAVGTCMDYEGRDIKLLEDDFAVFTEQAR